MRIDEVSLTSNPGLPLEVSRYIKKYGIEGWTIEISDMSGVENAVVIPALMEYDNIIKLLLSLSENDATFFYSTAFIFLINNPQSTEADWDNKRSILLLRNIIEKNHSGELENKIIQSGIRIALIDASSPGKQFPIKDAGVGLARKIGMDLSLALFDYNKPGKRILVSLDADCAVDKNYLTEIVNFYKGKVSAAVIKYAHPVDNTAIAPAIICYELFMRYYLLGLQYAGSRFAYHTIGSTISSDHLTYMKAEGMSKKKAGEDFYFLEKVAKNTGIKKINTTTVYPSSRISGRVPFGTGPRIARFLSAGKDEYMVYNPETFVILKLWIELFHKQSVLDAQEYLNQAESIHPGLRNFLEEQNFSVAWQKILKHKDKLQIQKQKYFWFDAFKTLKFVHYLRDNYLPQINMFDAIDELLKYQSITSIQRDKEIPEINIQKEYLYLLRKLT